MLAAGLLFLLIAGLWFGLVHPAVDAFRAAHQRNEALDGQLDRYERAAAQLGHQEEKAKLLRQALAEAGLAFDEQSVDVAAARLQSLITELVQANQGQMRVAQRKELPPSSDVPAIAVNVSFSASNVGLVAILAQLEQLRPAVFVDALAVRSNQSMSGQLSDASRGPFVDDAILAVDIQAYAYVRREAKP